MSWPRSVASAVAIVGTAFGSLVVVPNVALTRLSGLDRSGRVAVATLWFAAAVVGLLWILRRLQARRLV